MSAPVSPAFSRWKDGYFSPVTASLDWCEANYQFSHYIAEMANTMSNLFTVWLALYGVQLAMRERLPTRYAVGNFLFALVGVGSFLFHATLKYEAQMGDELPMIWTATFSIWLVFDTSPGFNVAANKLLAVSLTLFDIAFAWSYYLYRNPVYHQMVFATLIFSLAFRITYLLKWSPQASHIPTTVTKPIGRLFAYGAAMFAFGFLIWNLDNIFCDKITEWKVQIGWPAAFLLEGHAWWHVLTAAGTYWMGVGTQLVSLAMKDDYRNYVVVYTAFFPFVKRKDINKGL